MKLKKGFFFHHGHTICATKSLVILQPRCTEHLHVDATIMLSCRKSSYITTKLYGTSACGCNINAVMQKNIVIYQPNCTEHLRVDATIMRSCIKGIVILQPKCTEHLHVDATIMRACRKNMSTFPAVDVCPARWSVAVKHR